MFKFFLRMLIASLVGFILFTALITNLGNFKTENIIEGIFQDIYTYSNTASQDEIISYLSRSCDVVSKPENPEIIRFREFCNDKEQIAQLKETCPNKELYRSQLSTAEYNQLIQGCDLVESNKLEDQCNSIDSVDFEELSQTCIDYNNGKLNKVSFFSESIKSLMPSDFEKNNPFGKITSVFNQIEADSIFIALILILILISLYFKDWKNLALKTGSILLNLGIMIIIPFLIAKVYITTNGIDTSFILKSILAGNSPNPIMAMKILFPLIIVKSYTLSLIFSSIFAFIIGMSLKIIFHPPKITLNPHQTSIDNHMKMVHEDKRRKI